MSRSLKGFGGYVHNNWAFGNCKSHELGAVHKNDETKRDGEDLKKA
jgi:hypothetical protein